MGSGTARSGQVARAAISSGRFGERRGTHLAGNGGGKHANVEITLEDKVLRRPVELSLCGGSCLDRPHEAHCPAGRREDTKSARKPCCSLLEQLHRSHEKEAREP